MLNGLPDEDPGTHKLRLSKRISIFFAGRAGGPDAEIPVAIGGGRLLANRIALQEKDCRHNHCGTESCEYSHVKKQPALQVLMRAGNASRASAKRSEAESTAVHKHV